MNNFYVLKIATWQRYETSILYQVDLIDLVEFVYENEPLICIIIN
jgi:hypothetical protein